ncbi:MAG: sulfur carrier protein ThiS [Candidatus Omnitrophica bacterium]|nr:sulfur carrier protein ThiS [Candidatus Omnitrophota bacterium]
MELQVNGKPMELPDGTTAAGLLQQLAVRPERVVVEVNLAILKRDQLGETVLKPGDEVEIVHFVGGGSPENVEWGMGNVDSQEKIAE